MSRLSLRLLVCGLAALAALTAGAPSALARAESPRIDVRAPAHVKIGQRFSVVLRLAGPARASGYEASLLYDRSALEFSGSFQGGRELGPIDLASGEAIGAYAVRPKATVLGGGQTVRILFHALHRGTVHLRLAGIRAVTFSGRPIPIATSNRSVSIRVEGYGPRKTFQAPAAPLIHRATTSPGTVRDVTQDRVVDRSDLDAVAMDWQTARMDKRICHDKYVPAAADANGDGCLDVADVQSFARGTAHKRGARKSAPRSLFKSLAGVTFTVDSTGDGADSNVGDGVCLTASATCTLRAAMAESNALSGPNTINFAIAGTGVKTIQLTGALPDLTDATGGTTIDGYSQPGAVPNTDQNASNAQIKIEVRGQGSGTFDALKITSANNVVKGIAFFNLRRSFWLYGSSAHGNSIQGDFIGTNAAGTFGFTTYVFDATGVVIESDAAHNQIGEATLAGRNVISGNARHGTTCYHAQFNTYFNNIVGLSPLGDRRLMNVKHGSDFNSNCTNNVVGGTGALQRNIFSGNGQVNLDDFTSGVEVSHGPGNHDNAVIGNCFGTNVTCTSAPSYAWNSHYGIRVEDTPLDTVVSNNIVANSQKGGIKIEDNATNGTIVTNNRVGIGPNGEVLGNLLFGIRVNNGARHSQIGPGNVVAYNPIGIEVQDDTTDFNTITRNSIFSNNGLGIELDPVGVTPNDPGDADTGPNNLLNFPVITSATTARVTGTACGGCTVELFIADGDPSGFGEGKTYVASATATSGGNFSMDVSLTGGQKVTTTATDSVDNTSEFSENVTVTSGGVSLPGAPTLNGAIPGNNSVTLQWSAPGSDGGASITNYKIYRGTTSGGETLLNTVGVVTSYTDSTAQNETTYFYKVSAVNSVGEGGLSNELSAKPTAPTVFVDDDFNRTVASGFGSAPIGGPWSVSASSKTKVGNGQGVIYNWTAGNQDVQAWIPTTRTDMELLGLVRLNPTNPTGANYQARVMARAQTNPRNGYAAVITHTTTGAVTWRLARVDNAGGAGSLTLSSGTLLASGGAGTNWWIRLRAVGTNLSVKFWQNGTTEPSNWTSQTSDSYWSSGYVALGAFAVAGLTAPFPSIGFDSIHAETPGGSAPGNTVPGEPTLTTADPGNNSVALQWSTPSTDGGSPITSYKIYRGTTSGGETLLDTVGTVTSYSDATAQNGTPYFYQVSADNTVGEGAQSNELSVMPATVPGTPVLSTATPANNSVALQWSAPSSDGGSSITNYKIFRGTSSGDETLLDTVEAVTSYTDSTVQNGTAYFYEVSAVNSVGEGALSNERSATPQPSAPGAPTLTSATPGNNSVALQWSPPSDDGGSSITNYNIYRGTSSSGETLLDTVGTVTSYSDTTAQNGTTYFYRVSAVNGAGEGPLSNERSAKPAGLPGAPTLNSANPGDNSVTVQWSAPGSNGGASITNYKIYRGTTSGGETLLNTVGAVTSYTDSSAQNGTAYFYEVSAVNSLGEGGLSNELSATPTAPTVFVDDDFNRTVASGFGSAAIGGPWSVSASAKTKVGNGQGVIYNWTGGNQDVQAWIPTTRTDMELLTLVRLNATNPVGATYQARLMARAQNDARNGYAAVITHATTGAVNWRLSRIDNAGGTGSITLSSGTLLASGGAGTNWWIRLRVVGTSISVRFWQDGTTEPAAWTSQKTDSYWSSGFASLGAFTAAGISAPFPSIGFDSFTATNPG